MFPGNCGFTPSHYGMMTALRCCRFERSVGRRGAMTELSDKVKTALDETRTLILGSQILIGFQFQAVFQDAFEQLPAHARWVDGAALILMVSAAALLIAPGVYHRIVENGQDSSRIHHLISIMAAN